MNSYQITIVKHPILLPQESEIFCTHSLKLLYNLMIPIRVLPSYLITLFQPDENNWSVLLVLLHLY